MPIDEIQATCDTLGARTIYESACARLAGDRRALPNLGIPDAATLAEADLMGRVAYRLMSDRSQAADIADASIRLVQEASR